MDLMINHLNILSSYPHRMNESELAVLADYLMGKIPLEETKVIIKRHTFQRYIYSSRGLMEQMGDVVLKNPSLFPRMGRYIALLEYISPNLCRDVIELLAERIPVHRLYLEGELGVPQMLDFLFRADDSLPKALPALEYLLEHHPGELEDYIYTASPHRRFLPLVFLCARRGIEPQPKEEAGFSLSGLIDKLLDREKAPLSALLAADLIAAFWVFLAQTGKYYSDFESLLQQEYPQMLPLWQDKGIRTNWNKQGKKLWTLTNYAVYGLWFADGRLEGVNKLARLAAQVCSQSFVERYSDVLNRMLAGADTVPIQSEQDHIYRGCSREELLEKANNTLAQMGQRLATMGIDPIHMCRWLMYHVMEHPLRWKQLFDDMYGGNLELLRKAIRERYQVDADSGPVRAALLRYLYDAGETSVLAEAEQACLLGLNKSQNGLLQISDYLNGQEEKVQALQAWLLEDGSDFPEPVQFPEWRSYTNCAFDFAVWTWAGISPVARRYLAYLGHCGNYNRLALCVDYIMGRLGWPPEEIGAFLLENAQPEFVLTGLARIACGYEGNSPGASVLPYVLKECKDAAAVLVQGKELDAEQRLYLFDRLYELCPDYDENFLIACLGDASKKVRQHAISFLMPRKDLMEKISPLREAKKKVVREAAEQLMAAYEGAALGGGDGAGADLVGYCTRNLPRNARNSFKWAFPDDLPVVRWKDGGAADEVVVEYYLSLMLSASSMEVPAAALELREALNQEDLRSLANQLYGQWISNGAPAKQKGALLMYGFHAGDEEVLVLNRQIDDWAQHSRGAIAASAVWAMALGGSDLALMAVDSIGRKFKNKQVRRAGVEAFGAAANLMGTTPDVLGDRIIPTLGFDERGEREIDYGPRKFTAILSTELTIQLQDQTGKVIKSLPKPGVKDDEALAVKAKAEFTALKKSLKAVVTTQSARLEQALATGRKWDKEAWRKLFVQNPIMHSFAIGLVWGVYNGDSLTGSFRYMEDGTFTTVDEEEFDFDGLEQPAIGLVHPLDLDRELLEQWKEQLSDYDVKQPINQMERQVFRVDQEETENLVMDLAAGKKMLGITLLGRLQKAGWYKGAVLDGGGFFTFYREIGGIGAELLFSGMYISPDPDEEITLGQMAFYRVRENRWDLKKGDVIPLGQVPPRIYSELAYDVYTATASSTETNEMWRKDTDLLLNQHYGWK